MKKADRTRTSGRPVLLSGVLLLVLSACFTPIIFISHAFHSLATFLWPSVRLRMLLPSLIAFSQTKQRNRSVRRLLFQRVLCIPESFSVKCLFFTSTCKILLNTNKVFHKLSSL